MIRASSSASWNAPLPPLSTKQLQAATESHNYAVAHDLVLGFETNEHLLYHHSVVTAEQQRIPAAERSLAEDHLPPLVLPPTTIAEPWVVPQRVAGVLEAACRWLTDDELKACEEAVVGDRKKRVVGGQLGQLATLKLERPLLCSDHDEDYAELQRISAKFADRGEDGVRNHRVPQSSSEEEELFAVPKEASEYAAYLDEKSHTETMVVSEQALQTLVSLMSSMTWTDDDQAAFIDQEITAPDLVRRYVSPPLPPVSPVEYFVPEGDVCLVPDASDFGSSVSEALEEAERLLADNTGEQWKDEAVDFDMSIFDTAISSQLPNYSFDNLCSSPRRDPSRRRQESDLPLSPPSLSSTSIARDAPGYTTEDENIISTWIDEPMFTHEDLEEPLSDGCYPEANCQVITAESLLDLEENEIVAQAKISVPAVSMKASLPDWHAVGDNPTEMLQYILHESKGAAFLEKWPLGCGGDKTLQHDEQLNTMAAHYEEQFTETLEVDVQLMKKATSWLGTVPDIETILIDSVKPIQPFRRVTEPIEEEPLEIPEEKVVQQPPRQDSDSWGGLMDGYKRRKKQITADSTIQYGTGASPTAPQTNPRITSPELLIGFKAFADSSMPVAEPGAAQQTSKNGTAQPPTITAKVLPGVTQSRAGTQQTLVGPSTPQKAIFSISIPRPVRTLIARLLPNLEFIERDYQQHHAGYGDIDTNNEADIVLSPCTGILIATMVALRQTDGQRRLVFQSRVEVISCKYETLHILVYRANARPAGEGGVDLPELSPSDAMALAQFQGFVRSLPCRTSASYVGGGEQAVAQWIASLYGQEAGRDARREKTEHFLVEEETHWELFLRHAGFNVYDAQIALGILREADEQGSSVDGRDCVRQFIEIPSDERLRLLGPVVGCKHALARVNRMFTEVVSSSGHLLLSHKGT